jgi:4'-phosphopantetheinyl transferase
MQQPWDPPPETLTLAADEVHVWRASLNLTRSQIENLGRTLATDELERAGRFHFPEHRDHFVAARGVLRAVLGRYLGVEPSQLRFCYGPHGKPELAERVGAERPHFNVSHSHGLALYAVTRDREIGVDLEYIRPDLANEAIAGRFFATGEVTTLRGLPASMKPEGFFNCWTRKEAYIKARGDGLALPLDQFEVSLVPGEPATLLRTAYDPQEAGRWSLQALDPGPGYVAALAVEGQGWQLRCWQWSE